MILRLVFGILVSVSYSAGAETPLAELAKTVPDFRSLKNFDELARETGLIRLYTQPTFGRRRVRVAVFDNSFAGYEKAKGRTLPSDVRYFAGPVDDEKPQPSPHGLKMAETVYDFATQQGRRPELAPEIFLFRVTGFTNFQSAITEAIRLNVDIVLHSMVREFGSNFDGKGFLNSEVNRALSFGILWINAAGNYARTTFNLANFITSTDGWVELPGPNLSLPIRCTPLQGAKTCRVRIVLSWNSFSDSIVKGTNKDLDLLLTDDTLNIVGGSQLTQAEKPGQEGQSLFPRESIDLDLNQGRYFLRVKNRSRNFTHQDQLRIVGTGEGLSFEHYDSEESVLNPADNPRVLTVGAWDSELSSQSRRLHKPDLLAPSIYEFDKNLRFAGSSNAAALTAAVASVLLSDGQKWSLEKLKTRLSGQYWSGSTPSAKQLGFAPLQGNCFPVVQVGPQQPYIEIVRSQGGVFVQTNQGLKMMLPFDPLRMVSGLKRERPDDVVAITPEGWVTLPREQVLQMPGTWAEVFAQTQDTVPCQALPQWTAYETKQSSYDQGGVPRLRVSP